VPRGKLLAVTLLFSSSFAWFFVFYANRDLYYSSGTTSASFLSNVGFIALLVSVAVSAFLGSFIAGKVDRRKLLFLSLVSGVLFTVPMIFLNSNEFMVIWEVMAGLSFGVGFPSCQAFLADATAPDERGRVAGIVITVTFVLVIFSTILRSVLDLGLAGLLLLTIGLKSIGFLSFKLDPISRVEKEAKPWRAILSYRDFNRYLLAFCVFMIAAGLVSLLWQAIPNTPPYDAAWNAAQVPRNLGIIVFAMIAGLMADRLGRKKPIIVGLVLLGAAYAIVGLMTTPETFFVNLLLSGFAWGIILAVYLIVPGDLAFPGSTERFYTVGWVFPLILYIGVYGAGIVGLPLRIDVFSTALTMIVIAAVLPLLSAVETLSEGRIRERELREHAEKVSKLVQESQEADEK